MKQFIPLTDDMVFGPNPPPSPLVPYQVGMPCFHRVALNEPQRPALRRAEGGLIDRESVNLPARV